ncbi:MAG: transcription elongation factor GreA [bacterium]|nr:transcription elongation factor GreA [bacterium]
MNIETKEYLTKDKYEELKKKIEKLRTVGRKEVAEELEYAKQLGDLSENAEYHSAREKQAMLEDEIGRLDNLLKSAVIVDSHTTESVTVGSIVEIQKEGKTDIVQYTIVGSEEANMALKKLSNTSPLGQALRGKKKGETFSLQTPGGTVKYKVLSIS